MHTDYTESQQNIFRATVDTGSPAYFIIKKTANILVKSGANVFLLAIWEIPIDSHYVAYNRRTMK